MPIIHFIQNFFNNPFFSIVGGLTTLLAVVCLLYKITCSVLGISPLVFRMGKALWRRKIAIIGNEQAYSSLKECISDSRIFHDKNIIHILLDNLDKVKEQSLLLVDWESSGDQVDQIFQSRKSHKTAVIIFAKAGSIPPEKMSEVANKSNTVVVNAKGRLLNDILTSLITTSFEN
jgi:hypothetical protein